VLLLTAPFLLKYPAFTTNLYLHDSCGAKDKLFIVVLLLLLLNTIMINFTKDVKDFLPYDRDKYVGFFSDHFDTSIKWFGVSFQLAGGSEGKKIDLEKFIEVYEGFFESIISKLDNGSSWIVNHDDRDLSWLPNEDDNLPLLRKTFKENNIPNTFKGALIFTKNNLVELAQDLILYPYAVFQKDGFLYKDLDISHGEFPFIIKISGHLNIDLLSTRQALLRELVNEYTSSGFIIKEYKDTSLD
jgi:hypothetical protein